MASPNYLDGDSGAHASVNVTNIPIDSEIWQAESRGCEVLGRDTEADMNGDLIGSDGPVPGGEDHRRVASFAKPLQDGPPLQGEDEE